jgi:hypothetical protein
MKMILLVPKVVQNYKNQFPEVRHNAYKYFNYDNRVVNERVERFDNQRPYQGPDDFRDADYDQLIRYAKSLINPILAKYSGRVACEDALSLAIRSYDRGRFDGKVNAGRFEVLLRGMAPPVAIAIPVQAAKKKEKPVKKEKKKEEQVTVKPHILKQLGLTRKDIPMHQRVMQRVRQTGVPLIVREKGKHVVKK